jgi:hypothetical protein
MELLRFGKCFQLIVKEKFGLDEQIDLPNKFIIYTSEEETNSLHSETIFIIL